MYVPIIPKLIPGNGYTQLLVNWLKWLKFLIIVANNGTKMAHGFLLLQRTLQMCLQLYVFLKNDLIFCRVANN